jgi:hypothetical protein
MEDIKQLVSDHTTTTVNASTIDLNKSKGVKLNLDPDYQRNVVWGEQDKKGFLASILLCLMPENIRFNRDTRTQIKINRRQRYQTLQKLANKYNKPVNATNKNTIRRQNKHKYKCPYKYN